MGGTPRRDRVVASGQGSFVAGASWFTEWRAVSTQFGRCTVGDVGRVASGLPQGSGLITTTPNAACAGALCLGAGSD